MLGLERKRVVLWENNLIRFPGFIRFDSIRFDLCTVVCVDLRCSSFVCKIVWAVCVGCGGPSDKERSLDYTPAFCLSCLVLSINCYPVYPFIYSPNQLINKSHSLTVTWIDEKQLSTRLKAVHMTFLHHFVYTICIYQYKTAAARSPFGRMFFFALSLSAKERLSDRSACGDWVSEWVECSGDKRDRHYLFICLM